MASIAHGDPCVNRCMERRIVPTERSDVRAFLAAANARLMARRAQLAAQKPSALARASSAELPHHLGWGRVGLHPAKAPTIEPNGAAISLSVVPPAESTQPTSVVVQPSLLAAMLKAEVVSIGRIYLLCRHIDQAGRGWLAIDELRHTLTSKQSALRVCGWRRLRQILQAGKGVFWERDDFGRLWLFSLTRVAALLNVQRFAGDAVALPLKTLLGSIGNVRSAFYATFHCGRDSMPISRATLRDITGVAERTQRNYDADQAVTIKSNLTLLQGDEQQRAFEKGRAAFPFIDKMGNHGAVNKRYLAVRLPNSYQITRYQRLSGNQKRPNKQLRQDLVKYGTQGNSNRSKRCVFLSNEVTRVQKIEGNDCFIADRAQNGTNFWISVNL